MDSTFDRTTIFSPIDGSNGCDTRNVRIPSLGVEMEFCVATLKPGEKDPHPKDDRTITGMLSNLDPSKFGYLSRSKESVQTHIADSLNEEFKDFTVQSLKKIGEWIVKSDITVVRPRGGPEAYSWFPIEVNTPALLFSDAAVNHVQQVVDYLTGTYRINVNPSCGLHLHVGCQNAGFNLPHLKKICAIFWTFEPCFYYLVDEARWKNNECQLITRESRYRFGFNLRNLRVYVLYGQPEKFKRTIEIRFHEGTMDSEAIYHWIWVFKSLVQFAECVSTTNLESWLREYISDPEYGPFQLLSALKMPHQAWYYEKKTKHRWSKTGKVDLSTIP
ncbi:hypothetical protein BDZ45DRAFT_767249 [Acephala macrosclerotiorum]|nr:hypothetical protein BDZ45DRAFT_767249 [Acephala macrosclerotiorum]